jgi:hypothetical protein
MASCDYCFCLVCGSKAFYDSNLSWGRSGPVEFNKEGRPVPDGAGDYAGLCKHCAETFKLDVVLREVSG